MSTAEPFIICPTRDEATAMAVAESEEGEHVITHQPECECDLDGEGCTCVPDVTIVRRGEA